MEIKKDGKHYYQRFVFKIDLIVWKYDVHPHRFRRTFASLK